MVEVDYIGEGLTDEAVAVKLIRFCGGTERFSYARPSRGRGKNRVDIKLPGLNAGVAYNPPVLVLRDLDQDARCPSELVSRLLPGRSPRLVLRICVPSVDSWLMADRPSYARYCGLSQSRFPTRPEEAVHLKDGLFRLLESEGARFRRHIGETRRRKVPDWASFGEWQGAFAREHWNVGRACASAISPSLCRAAAALTSVIKNG